MFERTLKLIEKNTLEEIQRKKILLVGVGGVGGYALEALVRIGFQSITLIDTDTIEETNLNRQIISTKENIGCSKVEEAKNRALTINPNVKITAKELFLKEENIEDIFNIHYDYILDACDTITTKFLLIKKALEQQSKIITCLGTGNRLNPSEITITTLNKTFNDPLAKAMRKILKENHISLNTPVIWSKELPIKTQMREPGSIILVPASAGLHMIYFILNDILKEKD